MSQLPGGWSSYEPLTVEDRVIFDEAIKGLLGVNYQPTAVATQIVAGTNYKFKCNASVPPSELIQEAIVEIYAPLGDYPPHITGITRI